jgi:hypothetical protein
MKYEDQRKSFAVGKFRVKIKSLAAEARIIKHEEARRHKHGWVPACLRNHRIYDVRNEQRATLLAYALYRGLAYTDVERGSKKDIPTTRIAQILKSLGGVSDVDVSKWVGVTA